MSKKYYYHKQDDMKFVYFITPKVCTRSFFQLFKSININIHQADQYRELNLNECNEHFKFGLVRNPWDRLVSVWKNKVIDNHQLGVKDLREYKQFDTFIEKVCEKNLHNCDRHIMLQSELLPHEHLNWIGRFENITNDVQHICDTIGITNTQLPRINTSDHKHYTEYYDNKSRDAIAEKYSIDIETFNYKYD